jgi:PilZ domain-containing protein
MLRTTEKIECRVALVDLPTEAAQLMRQVFAQFKIKAVECTSETMQPTKQKYDACVVQLTDSAESLLATIRSSPLNRHIVIYGVNSTDSDFKKFSRHGINAVMNHPLERSAAMKSVRATHLLVLHEYRRYARIPVITEVGILQNGTRAIGTSVEVSGGGMSLTTPRKLKIADTIEVTLNLPQSKPITVRAAVSWIDEGPESQIGIRFEADDERRREVKKWVEDYLEIV